MNICNEFLLLENNVIFPDYWERLKIRLSSLKEKFNCRSFNNHTWAVQIKEWNLTSINSIEEYRLKKANTFRCIHCNKIELLKNINLCETEIICYNWKTEIKFECMKK